MQGQLETFRDQIPLKILLASQPEDGATVFDGPAYGVITPPQKKLLAIIVNQPCKEGSLLEVEGTSRSGPFYHVAGIKGGDYGRLIPGRN